MARKDIEDKVRFLRSLSFHIHKKLPPAEALETCIEAEGKGGRHRQWKQAQAVLEQDGFVPALKVADLVGPEAAAVLEVVEKAKDHRLMSDAISAIATWIEDSAH